MRKPPMKKHFSRIRVSAAIVVFASGAIGLVRFMGNLPQKETSRQVSKPATPQFPGPPGGPGGMKGIKLVEKFDKNGDGWLNAGERKAALAFLSNQNMPMMRGGPPGGRGGMHGNIQPGPKMSPADAKSYPGAPLYDPQIVRTLFLKFESPDWEKELASFHGTDVDVPAQVLVDGQTYRDVGVHFRGNTSFMTAGEGRKRSFVLAFDFVHRDQQLAGYSKLNLLNSAEDPSFLHTIIALQIARDYIPAPKANYVRVVINGEFWGIYINQQHFDKYLARDWFGFPKGARWKVPGPNPQGAMRYLGEDSAAYKQVYEIKSKDDPAAWSDLINLCRILDKTPPDRLERALEQLLDVDGTLKFLAWDNVLASGDGFYSRGSDYDLFEDRNGRFHLIPYDVNECFSGDGGPGGPGGPGPGGPMEMRGSGRGGEAAGSRGMGGAGRMGRPGGPGEFGPGMLLAPQLFAQADKNKDQKVARAELISLMDAWLDKIAADKTKPLDRDQFASKWNELVPMGFSNRGGPERGQPGMAMGPRGRERSSASASEQPGFGFPERGRPPMGEPPGFGFPGRGGPGGEQSSMPGPPGFDFPNGGPPPMGGPPGFGFGGGSQRGAGRGTFDPSGVLANSLFDALDANKNKLLAKAEVEESAGKLFDKWDEGKIGSLNEEQFRKGLSTFLMPSLGGRGRGSGGPGGPPPGGPGGGPPGRGGTQLDPLVAANNTSMPLLNKLLSVPALRTRYLGYVREIAGKWLDWDKLGPIAQTYHALIAADLKKDTRKLDSTEEFLGSLTEIAGTSNGVSGFRDFGRGNLKDFTDKRRAYLLSYSGSGKQANNQRQQNLPQR
jgi:hypothetical protein